MKRVKEEKRRNRYAAEGRQLTKKWLVSSRSMCLQCIVYAHGRQEAIDMARARSKDFFAKDTKAELSE